MTFLPQGIKITTNDQLDKLCKDIGLGDCQTIIVRNPGDFTKNKVKISYCYDLSIPHYELNEASFLESIHNDFVDKNRIPLLSGYLKELRSEIEGLKAKIQYLKKYETYYNLAYDLANGREQIINQVKNDTGWK